MGIKWNLKKQRRIRKLCEKRKHEFYGVMDVETFEKIDLWCKENLNGCYYWFQHNKWEEDVNIIGFQDETDKMAFKLRWT